MNSGPSKGLILLLALLWWSGVFGVRVYGQVDSAQTIVEVDIIGNRNFSRHDLLEVIETRGSSWFSWMPWVDPAPMIASRIRTDMLRLSDFYRNEGFLRVSVDTLIERQKKGFRVAFLVAEGEPVLIESVRINGIEDVQDLGQDRWKLKTVPGSRLNRSSVEDDRLMILSTLRESGFAFARVAVRSAIHPEHHRAIVDVDVNPGKRFQFGDVIVRGNRNVGSATIRRGVTFRPGMPFQQRKVNDARRQLYRSGAFRSVVLAFPDSLADDSTVSTVVTVSERSLRSVKVGAGYDTQNRINGSVSWTHRSVFGGAQKFKVGLEGSAVRIEGRASLGQPYVFGSRNWMDFSLFVAEDQIEDFSRTELGGTVTFERNIAARTTLSFEVGGGLVDFDMDSLFAQVVTGFTNDRRDDFLDPQRGLFVQLFARERGALFRGDEELLEFSAEGRWYSPLPLNTVLATKINGAIIMNLSENDEVPGIERLFAGGLSSVRGWAFNQLGPKDVNGEALGGKSKFEASIELRTRFGKHIGTAVFLDTGNVDEAFGAFDPARVRWAVGFGIRYFSPVGPVRLDAGKRLSDDITDLWQYHFSIGQAF